MNNPNNHSYDQVAERIKSASKVLVVSHMGPDSDAYSSTLALGEALKILGKEVTLFNASGIEAFFTFLPGINQITNRLPSGLVDLVVVVDCGSLERIGDRFYESISKLAPLVNIDHHYLSNTYFGQLNLVVEATSSTAEIVFNLLKKLGITITKDIAVNLMAGIYGDTVSLQKGKISAQTYSALAELYEKGGDPGSFVEPFFWEKPLSLLRLQGELLSKLTLDLNDQYASILITEEMLIKHGLRSEDCASLKDLALCVRTVKASSFIRPEDGYWKVSFRSKAPIDVNLVAQALGGGGHAQAAAARSKQSLVDFSSRIKVEIEKEFKRHKLI
jgi:phosphoesterase RecJ-like protein